MKSLRYIKHFALIFCTVLLFGLFSANPVNAIGLEAETRDPSSCTLEKMTCIYLDKTQCEGANVDPNRSEAPNAATSCWYCKIVIVLVNAYLQVASTALKSTTVPLGQIILKIGFLIWLAYYILQQVSSLEPVTPGKMLQEILVMGFKVSLAYLMISPATSVVVEYFVNPVVTMGVEYGTEIFKGLPQPH